LSKLIANRVKECEECSRNFRQNHEPLIQSELPEFPWQKLGTDILYFNNKNYLVVIDYFSRYIEIAHLSNTTTQGVIAALQNIFARHGIPQEIRSDNGPQVRSQEFAEFASSYGFNLITSSPHYPQSNGLAERAVQTVKKMLSKSKDPFIALLSYRSTPLPWCHLSPSELLMGRQLRTNLPQVTTQLIPNWDYLPKFREQDKEFKLKQKKDFDKHHRVRELPPLAEDTAVWMDTKGNRTAGKIVSTNQRPRSYTVETDQGLFQRNRYHLHKAPSHGTTGQEVNDSRIMTRSQTGTVIQPPDRFVPTKN
jgi:transposase InsO family protein